jgi:hypothetical protein
LPAFVEFGCFTCSLKQFFISGCLPFSELIGWIFAAGFDDGVFGLG